MTNIDRLLYEAKKLETKIRALSPVAFIGPGDAGKWVVRGYARVFSALAQAVDFSHTLAIQSRPVTIIIDDIPRPTPEAKGADDNGAQSTLQHSYGSAPDATAHF